MQPMSALPELAFESMRTLSQEEFEAWVAARWRGDLNHYELLEGRVVMTPGRISARVDRGRARRHHRAFRPRPEPRQVLRLEPGIRAALRRHSGARLQLRLDRA